jgi:hypothetical protein
VLRTAFRSRVKPEYHLVFLLSRRTHKKLSFSVVTISSTGNQKIFVQTQGESIGIGPITSVFKCYVRGSVRLHKARQKRQSLMFFSFEIIKTKTRQKVRHHSRTTTDSLYYVLAPIRP